MAAEMMLIGVAQVALEEGARFLYDQAGKVLDAWRARRRDPVAPPAVLVAAPAEVTVGPAQPSTAKPDGDTVVALEDLRADVERITTANCPPTSPPPGRRSPPSGRSSRRPSGPRSRSPAKPPARFGSATSTSSSTTSAAGSPGSASPPGRAATSRRCASRPTTWRPVASSSASTSAVAVPDPAAKASPSARSRSCSWPPTPSTPAAPARRGDARDRRRAARGGLPRPVRDRAAVGGPCRRPPGSAAPTQADIVHFSGHGSETQRDRARGRGGCQPGSPPGGPRRAVLGPPRQHPLRRPQRLLLRGAGAGHRRAHRLRRRDDERRRRRCGDRVRDRLLPRPRLRPDVQTAFDLGTNQIALQGCPTSTPAPGGQEGEGRRTCRSCGPPGGRAGEPCERRGRTDARVAGPCT